MNEREAVSGLRLYRQAQQTIAAAKRLQDTAEASFRPWLEAHQEPLVDGETGIEGRIARYEQDGEWDWSSMSDEVILRLARAGMLGTPSKARLDTLCETFPELLPLRRKYLPKGERTRISVTQRKP